MCLFSNRPFKSCNKLWSDGEASVFVDELIVVYTCIVFCIDSPWSDLVIIIDGFLLYNWGSLDFFNHNFFVAFLFIF